MFGMRLLVTDMLEIELLGMNCLSMQRLGMAEDDEGQLALEPFAYYLA